ncbi:KpsF/GutQ family sugar-phosphate isomerase [candidate division GN15 bacterium]|nr:KpsF/GutQ family sugar-phosphate isomerase [candidate division GN15 bacterium]
MSEYREYAREVIKAESQAVADLAERLDESFDKAIDAIYSCDGRVIVSGMGKSGLVGKKMVATFNSTGVASFFLHPAEAMHGDLGLMKSEDILLLISKSGRLAEAEPVLAAARRLGVKVIGLTGTLESELSERADIVLDCSVSREAGPNNLVPTSSSTVALVMGDALAMALLKANKFTPEDFAQLHPGGALGLRLLKRVSELHHTGDAIPLVTPETPINELILVMTSKRLGCVLTTDSEKRVSGIFTDGDLRRLVEKRPDYASMKAREVMIPNPKTVSCNAVLDAALALMEGHTITQLATVDDDDRLVGILHLHDILRSKLV